MDASLDSFGDTTVCSTLNGSAHYCQIEMDKDAKHEPGFATPHDFFRYKWTSFGVHSTLATVHRPVDVVLGTENGNLP